MTNHHSQEPINEGTKVDLSISNFWKIIITIVGFIAVVLTTYYTSVYATKSQIDRLVSGQELTQYKIEQLSLKLDTYVESRVTASNKMTGQSDLRTKQISWIQQGLVRCCPQYSPLN